LGHGRKNGNLCRRFGAIDESQYEKSMVQDGQCLNERGAPKMKNNKSKLSAICFILILGLSELPQETFSASQKSFLWKIQSRTNTVFVLGSLHYSKKEVYPLSEKIEKAFSESEILVVEADVNDMKKMDIQKLMERAFYPESDTLEKHVSKEIYERVVKEAGALGMPVELLNRQKPWFLAMTLVALESLKLGFDANLGIDKYFLSKAEGTKKILELESLDYQLGLLSGLSDKDQELLLLYTLNDLRILEQEVEKLTKAWTTGDTKGMESILTRSVSEDKRLSSIFEKVVYERNRKMASSIEDFLQRKESYFLIVGAGHLVGDRGIIEILSRKGYLIEQL
jgi:uncharacterized protein YbaP (TraB family)